MPQHASIDQPGPYETIETDYHLGEMTIQPVDGVFAPMVVPLEGLVTRPRTAGSKAKAPLVVLAHGRHSASVENFRGLAYLAHHLSSHGYVCASISLNALVGPQGTRVCKRPLIVTGGAIIHRAKTILRTIVELERLPEIARCTNFKNVGLIGHSRGAEAVALAGALSEEAGGSFGVRAAFSIAPVDFTSAHPTLPFFLLYGDLDGDVSDGQSFRLWDRAAPSKYGFYVHGAIHNYFSTNWDSEWEQENDQILPREQHEGLAKALTLAFMERHLRGAEHLEELLRGRAELPETLSGVTLARLYEGREHRVVDSGEGPFDVTTNTLGFAVTVSPDCSVREVDLQRFKVDTQGVGSTLDLYAKYHRYLLDPAYAQYADYLKAEIAAMVEGMIGTLRYFADASDGDVKEELASQLVAMAPDFQYTPDGWAALETNLVARAAPGLREVFALVDAENAAKHTWNQETKGISIDWKASGAWYASTLGSLDASRYRFLCFRVGQNYRSPDDPMGNQPGQAQDFSIVLEDARGRTRALRMSDADAAVAPPSAAQYDFKTAFRTALVPLERFGGADGVDLGCLTTLRFVFDKTATGSLIVDDLGFTA
ncbi:alpha/beta hydrolase family protein [Sorangium sp. So ce341]|uniref:alpha/beta hydrolase family protein n=1 Tax=Sorangium sp. So ce341 TaxID=3133302 RepID=UPI003F6453A5